MQLQASPLLISTVLHLILIVLVWIGGIGIQKPRPLEPDMRVRILGPLEEREQLRTGSSPQAPAEPRDIPEIAAPAKQVVQAPSPEPPQQAPARTAAKPDPEPRVDPQAIAKQTASAIDELRQRRERAAAAEQALKKLRERTASATAVQSSGERAPATPTRGNTAEPEMFSDQMAQSYLETLSAQIQRHFKDRVDRTAPARRDPVVRFELLRNGQVLSESIRVMHSSGSDLVDRSLIFAVQRVQPYEPFPDTMSERSIIIEVRGNMNEIR